MVGGLFGRMKRTKCVYAETDAAVEMCHRRPSELLNPRGDGACLPRALSLAIYGHENNHQKLRDAVVDYMLKGPLPGETARRDKNFEREMAHMRLRTTYMKTAQVEAFAYLLNTPIYTCVENRGRYFWQRLPHEAAPVNVTNSRAVYILNERVHFQLVLKP